MATEFDFAKTVDATIDFDLTSDVAIDLNKDVNLDVNVNQSVNLDGNFASATFSVEAIGTNTLAEADVHVLVIEGQLSSVDGMLIAAAG
jgi:hypothetical protein